MKKYLAGILFFSLNTGMMVAMENDKQITVSPAKKSNEEQEQMAVKIAAGLYATPPIYCGGAGCLGGFMSFYPYETSGNSSSFDNNQNGSRKRSTTNSSDEDSLGIMDFGH